MGAFRPCNCWKNLRDGFSEPLLIVRWKVQPMALRLAVSFDRGLGFNLSSSHQSTRVELSVPTRECSPSTKWFVFGVVRWRYFVSIMIMVPKLIFLTHQGRAGRLTHTCFRFKERAEVTALPTRLCEPVPIPPALRNIQPFIFRRCPDDATWDGRSKTKKWKQFDVCYYVGNPFFVCHLIATAIEVPLQ